MDRVHRGEAQVLTNETVTHLIPTSGSSGDRKLIPFTVRIAKGVRPCHRPMDGGSGADNIQKFCLVRRIGQSLRRSTSRNHEPAAVPIGFADDASYLGGVRSPAGALGNGGAPI